MPKHSQTDTPDVLQRMRADTQDTSTNIRKPHKDLDVEGIVRHNRRRWNNGGYLHGDHPEEYS